jgi:hypothetical protein
MSLHHVAIPFKSGRIVATRNVLSSIPRAEFMKGLERHLRCDWGDVSDADRRSNDAAIRNGDRLFSVYHSADMQKFWIITEADRSATTILLPQDY